MVEPYQIIIIVGALIFSAFFSGIEIAFLSADKLGMKLEGDHKSFSGRILSGFLRYPDRFISTTLIGNTIALVIYSTYMAKVLDPFLHAYLPAAVNNNATLLILKTLLSTLGILVVAEFIPKSIFLLGPHRLLSLFALPTAAVAYVLQPLVVITTAIAKFFITHVLGKKYREERPSFGLTDLHRFIQSTLNINENVHAGVSARIVSNLIEFKKVKVRDCMIPRTEIVAVGIEDGIEGLKEAVIKSNHAKVLVYRHDIDDIIGYCHAKELFKKPQHIESILRPVVIVSATNLASEVMVQLTTEGKSLALVVDEFGGTSGIVSMEDIIEEIVGEIQNEHVVTALVEQKLDRDVYLLSARHEIDYLNEKYGWNIPKGDYDTLSGLIIHVTARIPDLNETVELSPFTFTIVALEDTRIGAVKVAISKSLDGS
jgi:putative hemolysin